MIESICLVGNPNCGKTSLFNELTGLSQKVGNWSGVTTEKKEGFLLSNKKIRIIDLPGIYSLSAKSIDEKVVIEYLSKSKPSAIINVLDGTNLERNLYLTLELIKLNIPMVIAINFCDELIINGITVNHTFLQSIFGVKTLEISAKKKTNLQKLLEYAYKAKKPDLKNVVSNKSLVSREFISKNIDKIISKQQTKRQKITEQIDSILLHKVWSIPIFALTIFFVYFISSFLGGQLSDFLGLIIENFTLNTKHAMLNAGFSEWAISLVTQAIIKGVGSVLSFAPQILILFFFITIMEESGYATRISFIFDSIFRKVGLGGKSLIPLAMSCGCAVTGIMATRTIENESERKMTVFLTPFMPCGAKIVVFSWFSYCFFNDSPLISTSLYFLSIFCVALFGQLLKRLKIFKNEGSLFILEMPLLRFPSIKNILLALWEKFKDFTFRSGTVIFLISIALWILSNFGINGYSTDITKSFLYLFGNAIKYIFYPLGFGNWQASVSIITGLFAKEAVVETLEIIAPSLNSLFSNYFSVYAFMSFVLLSPPCLASIICAKNELNNNKQFVLMLLFQFISAYIIALTIVLIGRIITFTNGLIFLLLLVIIITILLSKKLFKKLNKSLNCDFILRNKNVQRK